jgi:formate hydrogenlyase subunit 3/multisubunit Na+/H+ antiporter MnhD subunit
MALTIALASVAGLLTLAALAIFISRTSWGRTFIYGGSLAISAIVVVIATQALLGAAAAQTATLPLGLPWLGAHFRLDALSAFFLLIVDFGGAAASLTRSAMAARDTQRVLPFHPPSLPA